MGSFSYIGRQFLGEFINSGLDYWNGGIVERWTAGFLFLFSLFVRLYLLCSFGRSLLHICVAGLPDFEGNRLLFIHKYKGNLVY